MKKQVAILSALVAIILLLVTSSCGSKVSKTAKGAESHKLPDTLLVGTLYSPTSLFILRGDTMGYEYERIRNFARDHGIQVKFVMGANISSIMDMLKHGKIDVIAYEIPITAEYKSKVLHCGTEDITHQVLVQPKKKKMITDVTQLIGKEVYVEKGSKYESRLKNLDNEVGGGIKIMTTSQDTLSAEDLIDMVSKGKLPLTIVDSDIAKINSTYYNNIDISLEVSFPQRSSWAVRKEMTWLADTINVWSRRPSSKKELNEARKRYFETNKSDEYSETTETTVSLNKFKRGAISSYDEIFKKYAHNIGWDWRMLAAQAYIESRFNNSAVSWAGAKGLMQLMPSTARAYGLSAGNVANPDLNVKAAVKSLKDLDSYLSKKVPDKSERKKFIIAAYNSGIGHINDAIALARKYGKNPAVWDGNVSDAIMWKSNPEFYNDPVCRNGYFRGRQTVAYVAKVQKTYELYCAKASK
jgi:membrane-bound lytic murein transglycosylase F